MAFSTQWIVIKSPDNAPISIAFSSCHLCPQDTIIRCSICTMPLCQDHHALTGPHCDRDCCIIPANFGAYLPFTKSVEDMLSHVDYYKSVHILTGFIDQHQPTMESLSALKGAMEVAFDRQLYGMYFSLAHQIECFEYVENFIAKGFVNHPQSLSLEPRPYDQSVLNDVIKYCTEEPMLRSKLKNNIERAMLHLRGLYHSICNRLTQLIDSLRPVYHTRSVAGTVIEPPKRYQTEEYGYEQEV